MTDFILKDASYKVVGRVWKYIQNLGWGLNK